jgi:hypothetical protein
MTTDIKFLRLQAETAAPDAHIWVSPAEILAVLDVVHASREMTRYYEWDAVPYADHGLPEKHLIDALGGIA